jgi:hypothetical protein
MSDSPSQTYRSALIAGLVMTLAGGLGLVLLLTTSLPTVGPRWLFFFLTTMTVTGIALPFVWLLNVRFGNRRSPSPGVLAREALLVGLYVDLALWLQINRSLSLPVALLLAAGIATLEWFLRLLDRSAWKAGR